MKIYRFRVVIDTKEDVFRDVEIRSDDSFESLYNTIVEAFGFQGGVMSSFYMSNENWDKGEEITLLDMSEGGDGASVMNRCILSDYMQESRQRLLLVYDFMRMWCFYVELIDELPFETGVAYPRISMQLGKAPKEESKDLNDELHFGDEPSLSEEEDPASLEDEIGDMFGDFSEYGDDQDED